MPLPRMLPVRQHFPDRSIPDVRGEVLRQLSGAPIRCTRSAWSSHRHRRRQPRAFQISPPSRARPWITGNRKAPRPFIFPAMGSHGGATAEGQADVLAHYGIHEATMECPVISSLEVVSTGRTPEGIETFMDRSAFESDGVMVIGRVKWHTDFSGKLESGLFKMTAIGLGKFAGAQRYHVYGYKLGLEHVIRTVGRQVLTSGKILGGLAILEDANHNTGRLMAVPAEEMERTDEELLLEVRGWMGRIPFPLDVLIVDEIGKNISGSGMDSKVVNRSVHGESNPWHDDAAHGAHFHPRFEPAYLWQRDGRRHGGRGAQPPARKNRLGGHAGELAHREYTHRDPHAHSFRQRSGVPGTDFDRCWPRGPVGSDLRMDQEFDGAGISSGSARI